MPFSPSMIIMEQDSVIYLVFNVCVCVCVCAQSFRCVCVTSWTVAHQAPLSMEFSRQEYWSGLPFPPP